MDSTIQLDRTTLKDWESRLAPQVRQVELLGEIPITADVGEMIAQIARNINSYLPNSQMDGRKRCPVTEQRTTKSREAFASYHDSVKQMTHLRTQKLAEAVRLVRSKIDE